MAQSLSSLNLNAKVKFGKHQVNEEVPQVIIWRIVAKNHSCIPAYPDNSITLHTDKVIDKRSFDSAEPLNPNEGRKTKGTNFYSRSNIAQWLNSSANAGEWYESKHEYDNPPDDPANMNNLNTCYANRAGFLYNFSVKEINSILTTTLRVAKSMYDGEGYEDIEAKVFLPSIREISGTNENGVSEGAIWPAYPDTNSRISYDTQQCYDNTLSTAKPATINTADSYFLRSPNSSGEYACRTVNLTGNSGSAACFLGSCGTRPALNLSGDTLVSDEPDAEGCYTVIFNDPPVITAAPSGSLGVQSTPLNQIYKVTDPNGDSLTVTEKLNGEVIRTLTDQPSGAKLTLDLTSMWQSLTPDTPHIATIEVTDGIITDTCEWTFTRSNAVPIITAEKSSGSLGKLAVPLNQEYTIIDPNKDKLTVTEMLDGQVIRTLNDQQSGTTLSCDLTGQWELLSKDIPHTATIEVTDGLLTTHHIWTFNVIDPIQQQITSNQSAQQPTDVVIPVLPVEVIVTNNANDPEPVWEDASKEYLARKQYTFKNNTKTADEWCVGVKYTVNGVTIPVKLTTKHEIKF